VIKSTETNNKIKNIRDMYGIISDFKKGYQPRTKMDEKGDFLTACHNVLVR
jgi:hypothetical protein